MSANGYSPAKAARRAAIRKTPLRPVPADRDRNASLIRAMHEAPR